MQECANRLGKSLSLNGAVERTKEGKNWARTGALRGAEPDVTSATRGKFNESRGEREREREGERFQLDLTRPRSRQNNPYIF